MEKKEPTFEEKLEKLEHLVKQLENGDIPLEKAIESYTEAMKLAKKCDEELKTAESSLTKIVNEDGSLSDFSAGE